MPETIEINKPTSSESTEIGVIPGKLIQLLRGMSTEILSHVDSAAIETMNGLARSGKDIWKEIFGGQVEEIK